MALGSTQPLTEINQLYFVLIVNKINSNLMYFKLAYEQQLALYLSIYLSIYVCVNPCSSHLKHMASVKIFVNFSFLILDSR
jgi:hypothetical protein